jgi:hypothetical protein
MKKRVYGLTVALALILPGAACAADLGVSSTTLFRLEQRSFPGFAKQTAVPATEFIGADLDSGNLSLHLYGWGRVDLADRSTSEGDTDGDLSYAYLSYRLPTANGEVKGGRFFINEGVAVEQVDGLSARTDLQHGFTLALFGGAPVKLDRDSRSKGDYIVGGRGSWRLKGVCELGVSGLREGAVSIDTANGTKDDRQMVGGDIWLSPYRTIELNGHTFYNASREGLAEHSYLLALRPHKAWSLSGTYNEQNFKNYFAYSNIRSLFNPDNDGELKSYGGGASWTIAAPVELLADYRHYRRTGDLRPDRNGDSDRYGGDVRVTLSDRKVRSGLSYHRSDGASGFNSYHEVRGFGLYDAARYVTSLDAIGQFFKESVFGRKEAFEVIASAGYRIVPELLLSGDVGYGRNPQFDDEVRGVVRLTYNYSYASKGAKK